MEKLTIKQQKFCDYYIQTGNATESAKKAGYSSTTASVIGFENLKKPYIKNYIDEQRKQIHENTVAKTGEILEFWSSIMRSKDIPVQIRLKASEYLGKAYDITVSDKETQETALEKTLLAINNSVAESEKTNKLLEEIKALAVIPEEEKTESEKTTLSEMIKTKVFY